MRSTYQQSTSTNESDTLPRSSKRCSTQMMTSIGDLGGQHSRGVTQPTTRRAMRRTGKRRSGSTRSCSA